MWIEELEAMLRSRGWEPTTPSRTVSVRGWKRIGDTRPTPTMIHIPRVAWIRPDLAYRILRRAGRTDLR
jgi:hypothetical protein